ncbi:MAG: metallophosphoesterase [Prevotella sp.]|nr:metallophosphoesterase [Prevotella sp.]
MIARAPYLFLLLIIVPDVYFDLRYWRHRFGLGRRIAYWIPTIILTALTLKLTYETEFIPKSHTLLYIYLLMIGLIVAPKWAYMLCSIVGMAISKVVRIFRKRSGKAKNYGNLIGIAATIAIWYIVIYGSFVGIDKLEVKHYTYTSADIPRDFDGYKIVFLSDMHVGTMTEGREWMVKRLIDTINAQNGDMIAFTGDLQNVKPQEIRQQMDLLGRMKAKDGVFSVLGNHDYDKYMHADPEWKTGLCKETIALEKRMGWHLLMNEHRTIHRGNSSITISGMENDGDGKRFPQRGNIKKAIGDSKGFIVMLEHDPSSWRRKIIPDGRAQLTLSGHTHAMQFKIFGWSPMALLGKEWNGWYKEGEQSLLVTAGAGALIPFRFGASAEIVVIELKSDI